MGTEVEYGISVQGQPAANPMVACSQVVNAYAQRRTDQGAPGPVGLRGGVAAARRPRLRPVRAASPTPSQLTDEDLGLANVILTNGARLYVDHAHPEYSTPEVHHPARRRALGQGRRAGDARRRRGWPRSIPGAPPIHLYKNNTDNKGASLRRPRELPDAPARRRSATSCAHLTPFFVSRQVVCGAGRVGIGQDGREHGFQISQRADFFEVEVGPRDHAQAADHQHPRRAARRPREVPPAARHHRRRQPRRDLDLPQGRHHRAGARDDRGPVHRRRPRHRRPGRRAARGLATTRP